jgi:hypothetical protein
MPEVTYARLDEVFRSLGFSVSEPEPGTRVYRHAASGALLILPTYPDRDIVLQHYLVGARMTLDAFGGAEPLEFTSRLQ